MAERGDDVLGRVLAGRYRVEAFLGTTSRGGIIFRGRDAIAETTVVVRCPITAPGLEGDAREEAFAAFLEEARVLQGVCGATTDVERLLAFGIEDRTGPAPIPFTVFEWLAGRTLERQLAAQPRAMSLVDALAMLAPAVAALAAAHRLGIAHGDVRPANLWLDESGAPPTLKLASFDRATRIGAGEPTFVPSYGAPEHFNPAYGAVGPHTDVYGIALSLVEMTTGKRALVGETAAELYLATSDLARRPTPRAHGVETSDALEAVLVQALAVDPKRRWADASALWTALAGVTLEPPPKTEKTEKTERRAPLISGRLRVAGACVVALAALAAAFRRGPHSATGVGESVASTASTPRETAVSLEPFLSDMVKVPAGTFMMGSDRDGKGERPLHAVTVSRAFYIDRTEVTTSAYAICVDDKVCPPNRIHFGDAIESEGGCTRRSRPRNPVNCVDRREAEKYCAFVQKRLPTEAEWEYAARGPDRRDYPWGDALPTTCEQAILPGMLGPCGERRGPWDVGTTPEGKSPFGAVDMAGNLWEWVADGWDPDAYDRAPDAAGPVDPRQPLVAGGKGIVRGGSWDYSVSSAKVTYRLPFAPIGANISIGFRCARDAE